MATSKGDVPRFSGWDGPACLKWGPESRSLLADRGFDPVWLVSPVRTAQIVGMSMRALRGLAAMGAPRYLMPEGSVKFSPHLLVCWARGNEAAWQLLVRACRRSGGPQREFLLLLTSVHGSFS